MAASRSQGLSECSVVAVIKSWANEWVSESQTDYGNIHEGANKFFIVQNVPFTTRDT